MEVTEIDFSSFANLGAIFSYMLAFNSL